MFQYRVNYYCGRYLGDNAITGSMMDRCGPFVGPPCASCKRLQVVEKQKGTMLTQSQWVDLSIASLVTRPDPWIPPGTIIKGYGKEYRVGGNLDATNIAMAMSTINITAGEVV